MPQMFQVSKDLIDSQTKGAESSFAEFLEIAVIGYLFQGYNCMFCYNNKINRLMFS